MNQTKHTRIAIAGIGGIGGYIGGKLACHYADSEDVEVVFIARGEMADAIKEKGLDLASKGVLYHCKPAKVADDPETIGAVDIFILCTKNFAVADVLKKYAGCLTANTTVITTQNTVNGREAITPYLPKGATLMEGSIYIASNITAPGKVEHISGPAKFIFGTDGEPDGKGIEVAKILTGADIDATYTTDITAVLWKKFMFVSPAAIVTAIFLVTFAEILENAASADLFSGLTAELMELATAKNVAIDANTLSNNRALLASFKGKATSSFQLDLEKGKPTEVSSLVNYVIDEARSLDVHTPYFDDALFRLTEKYADLIHTN